jgi:large subunit ribosomal protein L21
MYAIVDIKGFQYKIEKGATLKVPKLDQADGEKVKFSDVLLISDGSKVTLGTPYIENATVEATVNEQGKDKKIIVYKKKRRKDYSVKRGHRQDFTEITINNIKVGSRKAAKVSAETPGETLSEKE